MTTNRTEEQIKEIIRQCEDNINNGTEDNFRSYEEGVKDAILAGAKEFKATVIGDKKRTITLKMDALTDAEKQIILKGCLINFYKG